MTHEITWSVTDYLLSLQVDGNVLQSFPFNGFTPCPDLTVPLYLGGVKGQVSSACFFKLQLSHSAPAQLDSLH